MFKAATLRFSGRVRGDLEPEVRGDLVDALYSSTRSLAAVALATSAVAVAVALMSGLWTLGIVAVVLCAVGAARISLNMSYRAASQVHPDAGEKSVGQEWEWAFQAGAIGQSVLIGAFAVLTLLLARDPMLHIVVATMSIGYVIGVAGRHAGRPALAITQLSLAALPVAALPVAFGLLGTADALSRTLGFVTVVVFAGMVEIMLRTYDVRLGAFQTARRNEALIVAMQNQADETEAANAANAAKTRFLANMSHEIRTPLNGVLGMTEAMLADTVSDQQRARLIVVRQSGAALLTLLNDILDLSKVEAGKLELESAPFHLRDVLESVAATFADAAATRGIDFSVVVSDQDLGVYEGDGGRLRQILFNLISNALKFTQAGRVEVKVAFDGERLDVQVSDTGIGIAPEHLDRLFQRFSQADASTTRRFGGTGLGLAICQELTNLLNGHISAQSRLGEGATFKVSLPITRLAEMEAAVEPIEPSATKATNPHLTQGTPLAPSLPAATTRKLRVLCAEDNEVNQLVLIALLEPFDYDLTVVDDGYQAFEAYRTEAFDLILLDVQMPVMDGPAAAVAIRLHETQNNLPNTPIIALTANVMADQIQDYLASGMNQIVPKPINIDELYDAIKHQLSRAASQGVATANDRISRLEALAS